MKKLKRVYEPNVIVVCDGETVERLFYRCHLLLSKYNNIKIRTMIVTQRIGMIYSVCDLMKDIGYVIPKRIKEVDVILRDGGKMRNLQFDIELIHKFQRFNGD